MSKIDSATIDRYVSAWCGVSLGDGSEAVANECTLYGDVIEVLSADLAFDDEPSDHRHALAGRRGWRGKAR